MGNLATQPNSLAILVFLQAVIPLYGRKHSDPDIAASMFPYDILSD